MTATKEATEPKEVRFKDVKVPEIEGSVLRTL